MDKKYIYKESECKRWLGILRRDFYLMAATILVFVVLGETGLLPVGELADEPETEYALTVAGVICALASVYLGLMLFAKKTKDRAFVTTHYGDPLNCYRGMSLSRTALIAGAAGVNMLAYYLTMNPNSLLMSFIPLIALCFCWPTRNKLDNFIRFVNGGDSQVKTESGYNREEESDNEYQK